jgi:hypothetical protein
MSQRRVEELMGNGAYEYQAGAGVHRCHDAGHVAGVAPSAYFTSQVYISDAAANRIDVVTGVSRLGGD